MAAEYLLSVVIPAYNEQSSIGALLDAIKEVLREQRVPHELLVVDDGSSDETAKVAAEKGALVFSHPYNMGNGAAVKTGLRRARGKFVALLDADGQHSPRDLPRLLEFSPRYDLVVGARDAASHASRSRRWGNMVYNRLASYITGRQIEDLTSGFRVFRSEVAKKFLYLFPNGFSYPTTSTLALLKAGYSLKYVPVKANARRGKSKLNTAAEAGRFFLIILKISTLFSPFKVFFPLSAFSFGLGLLYGGYMIAVHRHFSNMVLLLLITGVLIFLMGLIAEEIALLRLERSEKDLS